MGVGGTGIREFEPASGIGAAIGPSDPRASLADGAMPGPFDSCYGVRMRIGSLLLVVVLFVLVMVAIVALKGKRAEDSLRFKSRPFLTPNGSRPCPGRRRGSLSDMPRTPRGCLERVRGAAPVQRNGHRRASQSIWRCRKRAPPTRAVG